MHLAGQPRVDGGQHGAIGGLAAAGVEHAWRNRRGVDTREVEYGRFGELAAFPLPAVAGEHRGREGHLQYRGHAPQHAGVAKHDRHGGLTDRGVGQESEADFRADAGRIAHGDRDAGRCHEGVSEPILPVPETVGQGWAMGIVQRRLEGRLQVQTADTAARGFKCRARI